MMSRALLLGLFALFISSFVQADDGVELRLCRSASEFEQSVHFFREDKSLSLSDGQVVKWSLAIAKGCDGASQRFQDVFKLLDKSGVELHKSVEMASAFTTKSSEQTRAFVGLFKTFFLENYFDLDFMTAFNLSLKLSENPAKADFSRKDFENLYRFCTAQDKLGLPFKSCAQYSLTLLKDYSLYPEGIYPSFEKIFSFLISNSGVSLNVKEAMQIASEVLSYGPLAPDNFKQAYTFSVAKKGLDTSLKQGMKIALEVTKASLREKAP